jgi:hypothetical protein
VSVPLKLRVRVKKSGLAGSGKTSSVSWTPFGTVSIIRANRVAQVALKISLDEARLIAVSRVLREA